MFQVFFGTSFLLASALALLLAPEFFYFFIFSFFHRMSKKFDVAIIGSGAAGSIATHVLVSAGLSVCMIDGGLDQSSVLDNWPQTSFEKTRHSDPFQRNLFLGEDLSGLSHLDANHSAQMTTGLKSYITKKTKEFLPIHSASVSLLQSLACGGLSEAWGGVCDFFDESELQLIGLSKNSIKEIQKSYQAVCDLIGVSGKNGSYKLQKNLKLDSHGQLLLQSAQKHPLKKSFSLYQPPLAILSKKIGKRKANDYSDLDFWTNAGQSVFRPHFLIHELGKKKNFFYFGGWVVDHLKENKNGVFIHAKKIDNSKVTKIFFAKKVFLAAGSANSTRIVLKSLRFYNTAVRIFIKPHVLIPCFHPRTLGQAGDVRRYSLCQLVLKYSSNQQKPVESYTQLYSYKSLLLYKLLPKIPLPTPLALRFLTFFAPSLVLADSRFTSTFEESGKMQLKKTGEKEGLWIDYAELSAITKHHQQSLHKIFSSLFRLGLIPLKKIFMPTGSTAHYAGGMPMVSADVAHQSVPLTTVENGKILQMQHVFAVDASTWNGLPAKPPTLTIMANAHRIANEFLVSSNVLSKKLNG
jgi:hypothetical protein